MEESLVGIAEVTNKTTLTEKTIRAYVEKQRIPHRRMGEVGEGKKPRIRFYLSEISAWLDGAELILIPKGITILK